MSLRISNLSFLSLVRQEVKSLSVLPIQSLACHINLPVIFHYDISVGSALRLRGCTRVGRLLAHLGEKEVLHQVEEMLIYHYERNYLCGLIGTIDVADGLVLEESRVGLYRTPLIHC